MKIGDRKIEGVNTQTIVIPRNNGDIILIAKGVTSYKPFMDICPIPTPSMKTFPDGRREPLRDGPEYRKQVQEWAERKTNWLILESLSATPGLEWEMVDRDKPETWSKYSDELIEAGFSEYEITRIVEGVMTANGINQEMITEAEKRFLAGQVAAQ